MTTAKIEIPLDYFETFGTASLTGMIINTVGPAAFSELTEVVFVIHETSTEWKRLHNGPYMTVTPEYTFECLVDDVVNLINHGIKFRFEHKIVQ